MSELGALSLLIGLVLAVYAVAASVIGVAQGSA